MKKNILTIILILLAIHLLYTNSILLMNFTEERSTISDALRILFAASYSIITVLIIRVYPKRHVFIISGILDGFSVAIKYLPGDNEVLLLLSALYFGIYTMFIVIIAGEITKNNEKISNVNEKKTKTFENKSYNELITKKVSIQNSLNRLKNENKREVKTKELEQINIALEKIQL